MELQRNSHHVFRIMYHFVWIPKYRHKVFIEPYKSMLTEIIQKIGYDYNIEIVELEASVDHIHMVVRSLDLADTSSDGEIYLSTIGYKENRINGVQDKQVYPQRINQLPTIMEKVEYNYGEYLYPASTTGTSLITSSLLFDSPITSEQAQIDANRRLDSLFAVFSGKAKLSAEIIEELKAIKEAIYQLYGTKSPVELAEKIADNPTKLAMVQAKIEQSGNQQWRDVSKLLNAIDLDVSVTEDGSISIGVHGDIVTERLSNGFMYTYRPIAWTESKPQLNTLPQLSKLD